MPGFIATMFLQSGPGGNGDVVMLLQAMAPIAIADGLALSPWIKITESINAGHDLVPAIIVFAVLFAWPYRSMKQGAAALALAVPACAVLLVWTIAVHFAGLLELAMQRTAIQHGLARPEPFVLTQMLRAANGCWRWSARLRSPRGRPAGATQACAAPSLELPDAARRPLDLSRRGDPR